jgi:hypothetical protein
MRRYMVPMGFVILSVLAGCQTEPSGGAYEPPCSPRAADANMCPVLGYKTTTPL